MKLNPKYLVPRSLRDAIRPKMKSFTYDTLFSAWYRKEAKKPIDPKKVLFIDVDRDVVSDSMRLVWDEMERRGYTCVFRTLRLNHGKFSEYMRLIGQMAVDAATAHYIFITDTCLPLAHLPLRSETKVI